MELSGLGPGGRKIGRGSHNMDVAAGTARVRGMFDLGLRNVCAPVFWNELPA